MVTGWDPDNAWSSQGSWGRGSLAESLTWCTSLGRTEVKRLVRRIASRELLEFEVSGDEPARSIIHALESMGATIKIE